MSANDPAVNEFIEAVRQMNLIGERMGLRDGVGLAMSRSDVDALQAMAGNTRPETGLVYAATNVARANDGKTSLGKVPIWIITPQQPQ